MAEQDKFGPPGNLSSPEGGSYIDDAKMAFSKFYDNYLDRQLTDKERQEVNLRSKMLNVSKANEDLVRHHRVGERYRGFPLAGWAAAFLGEVVGGAETTVYGPKRGQGGFSPDDIFATLYGVYGVTPEQVNNVGGFKHTESYQDMVKNKSLHQGLWSENFSKMKEIGKNALRDEWNEFNTSPSILGIDLSQYSDPKKSRISFYMDDIDLTPNITQDMMDMNFSKGMLGTKTQDPRGGGT